MDSDLSSPPSQEQKQESPNNKSSILNTFKNHVPRSIISIIIDVILPLAIFFALQSFIKPVYALILGGVPPFLMVICKAIISRKFDALGFLVLTGFIMSVIIGVTTEDPVTVLLGQSFITGVISSIFAITLIPFYRCHHRCQLRPLGFYLYQDFAPKKRADIGLPESLFQNSQEPMNKQDSNEENEVLQSKLSDKQKIDKVYEWMYTNCSSFRRCCYMITIIWSIGLLFGFLGQLTVILVHLPLDIIVICQQVIIISTTVLGIMLTIISVKKERKQTKIFIEEWKKEHLNLQ